MNTHWYYAGLDVTCIFALVACGSLVLTMTTAFGSQKGNTRAVLAHHAVFVANIHTRTVIVP